jgi:hypothetical protein
LPWSTPALTGKSSVYSVSTFTRKDKEIIHSERPT